MLNLIEKPKQTELEESYPSVMLNKVANQSREQFELFARKLLSAAAIDKELQNFSQLHVLYPTLANEDGTYTYVIIFDSTSEPADSSILELLQSRYGDQQVNHYWQRMSLAHQQICEAIDCETDDHHPLPARTIGDRAGDKGKDQTHGSVQSHQTGHCRQRQGQPLAHIDLQERPNHAGANRADQQSPKQQPKLARIVLL